MNITVLIANYNYGHFLNKAVNSVLQQDYPKDLLNLIIVDDGSTDGSVNSIYNKYQFKDGFQKGQGIEVVNTVYKDLPIHLLALKQNGGPSRARNIGIDYGLGFTDIFAILDADDEYFPNKLSKSVEYFKKYPNEVAVVYSDYIIKNEDGIKSYESKEVFDRQRLLQECIVHSNSLISKPFLQHLKQNDGYYFKEDMRTCEDYHLWVRLSRVGTIIHIPEPLMAVNVHSEDSTHVVNKKIWQENWNKVAQEIQSKG